MDAFIIEHGVLQRYNGPGGDVVIPYGVISIGKSAFRNCRHLTGVTIPEGVRSIGDSAFSMCSGLTSVTIPKQVTSIWDAVFWGCDGLRCVTILGNVTCFKEAVFHGCSALEMIIAPEISVNFWRTKDLKERGSGYTSWAIMGYLTHSHLYRNRQIIREYRNCILGLVEGKEIRTMIFQNDFAQALTWYTQHGAITAANFEKEFFQPAMEANAPACIALLLRWKNEHLCTNQIDRLFEL